MKSIELQLVQVANEPGLRLRDSKSGRLVNNLMVTSCEVREDTLNHFTVGAVDRRIVVSRVVEITGHFMGEVTYLMMQNPERIEEVTEVPLTDFLMSGRVIRFRSS